MERQRKSVRWWRKAAGVSLRSQSHSQNTDQLWLWQQKMSASDSLSLRLSVFFTPSLFISVSSVNFVSNNRSLSVWLRQSASSAQTLAVEWEAYWITATPSFCRSYHQMHKQTQAHLAFTSILRKGWGGCKCESISIYIRGVNAPVLW